MNMNVLIKYVRNANRKKEFVSTLYLFLSFLILHIFIFAILFPLYGAKENCTFLLHNILIFLEFVSYIFNFKL